MLIWTEVQYLFNGCGKPTQRCQARRVRGLETCHLKNLVSKVPALEHHMNGITFPVVSVSIVFMVIFIATAVDIFHFAVAIVGAARSSSITSIIVTVSTVALARRSIVIPRAAWWRNRATSWRTLTARWAAAFLTARVEAPRCGGWSSCPLYLETSATNRYGGQGG